MALGSIIEFYEQHPPRALVGELPKGYVPLPAPALAAGLEKVMDYIGRASRLRPGSSFLDAKAGDGRVVAFADALGMKPVGLEDDDELFYLSTSRLGELRERGLVGRAKVVLGSSLEQRTYERAAVKFGDVDAHFLHTGEHHAEIVGERVAKESLPGTILLHLTYEPPTQGTFMGLNKPVEKLVTTRLPTWSDHYLSAYMKMR